MITKAGIGDDHRLVRTEDKHIVSKAKNHKEVKKKKKKKNPFNINTQKLKGMNEIFEINRKNRFEQLEEVKDSNFSEIMKEEANILAGKTKEEPPVLSAEDQERKQLEDGRKELRKKENGSQREKVVYTVLNKTVKKKRRQRSRKKRRDHVETVLQSGRGPKHIYKGGPKKKMCEMKNKENEVQTDRNEILKVRARFYTELYSSTLQDQHPSLKTTNTDYSGVPPIMTSEVKKTMKEMKKANKQKTTPPPKKKTTQQQQKTKNKKQTPRPRAEIT